MENKGLTKIKNSLSEGINYSLYILIYKDSLLYKHTQFWNYNSLPDITFFSVFSFLMKSLLEKVIYITMSPLKNIFLLQPSLLSGFCLHNNCNAKALPNSRKCLCPFIPGQPYVITYLFLWLWIQHSFCPVSQITLFLSPQPGPFLCLLFVGRLSPFHLTFLPGDHFIHSHHFDCYL